MLNESGEHCDGHCLLLKRQAMHAPLGQLLVLFGLLAATFGCIIAFVAGRRADDRLLQWAQRSVYAYGVAMIVANLVMWRALLMLDFSVSYVAQVGSRMSPYWIRIVALWSSLEGSILFWGAILGVYLIAFTYMLRHRYREYMGFALGSMLFVAAFFAFIVAGPGNPFLTMDPVPLDGPGPNPLLQNHILMVVHPPLLYLGYVGMTVPFGIAMAALFRGKLTSGWLKPLRYWTMIPWMFLTLGIVIGGWWAYEVLGWGGYWAWDPVENASFLPWLAATGYLHSTVVQERKRILKTWTLTMAIGAFLLTILGTFMTRSGVFNSVHSFTQSPIGPMFLGFLAFLLIVAVVLLAGKSHMLEAEGEITSPISREAFFLINNALFAIFTFTVLLGTVFPLINEALTNSKISVGEPYFNRMARPIGISILFLMGVGPSLPWGRPVPRVVLQRLVPALVGGVLTAILCAALGMHEWLTLLTFALCGFALVTTLRETFGPILERMQQKGENFSSAFSKHFSAQRRRIGGYIVHVGVIVIIAAIAASQTYRSAAESSLLPGESFILDGFEMTHQGVKEIHESNRTIVEAQIGVSVVGDNGNRSIGIMRPSLSYYPTMGTPMGSPHVRTIGITDLYLSLQSVSPEDGRPRLGIKAFVVPSVALIWYALPLFVIGTIIALWPRPRRKVILPKTNKAAGGQK